MIGFLINYFDIGGDQTGITLGLLYLFALILNPFFAGQLTKKILQNTEIDPERVDKPLVIMYILTILYFLVGARIFEYFGIYFL